MVDGPSSDEFRSSTDAPTQIIHRPQISADAFSTSTQVIPTRDTVGHQPPPKGTSPILYVVIGILAAGFVAALIFIFVMPGRTDEAKKVEPANSPVAVNTAPPVQLITNSNSVSPVSRRPVDPTLTPAGSWSGDWSHDKGTSAFTATAELTETGGRVEGRIVWTLVRSSNPQKMDKSGLMAVEYVRGTFNPATRLMKLRGYRKDDPNNLVIYDAYNLSLSADKQTLNGRSKNGVFRLIR